MPAPVEITLRNMKFHVLVGILPHEAELPQPLEVDLTVWTLTPADAAIGTDYRDLYALVDECVRGEPIRYIEQVARDIVNRSLRHPNVIGARAAVRKPNVTLPGPIDWAEVVIEDGVNR